MKRWAHGLFVLVIAGLVFTVGCDGGGGGGDGAEESAGSDETAVENANVTGDWRGSQTTSSGDSYSFAVTLSQSGSSVSGTFEGGPEFGSTPVSGTISGTASGNHVVLTVRYTSGAVSGYSERWDGNLNAAGTVYSGVYTPNNGASGGTFSFHPL